MASLSINLSYCLNCRYNLPLQPPMAADSLHAKKIKKRKRREKKKEKKEMGPLYCWKRTHILQVNYFSLLGYLILLGSICSLRGGLASCEGSNAETSRSPFWFHAVFMQGPVLCFQQCYPWFPAAQLTLDSELMSCCVIHFSCTKLTNSWSPTSFEPAPIRRWNEAKQLYL